MSVANARVGVTIGHSVCRDLAERRNQKGGGKYASNNTGLEILRALSKNFMKTGRIILFSLMGWSLIFCLSPPGIMHSGSASTGKTYIMLYKQLIFNYFFF